MENDGQQCEKGEVQDDKNIREGKDITKKVNAFYVEEHMEIEDHIVEQKMKSMSVATQMLWRTWTK